MLQNIQTFYQRLSRQGRIGLWALVCAMSLIILLLAFDGTREPYGGERDLPRIVTLYIGERADTVRLVADAKITPGPVDEEYQPLTDEVRNQVIQHLGEFAARYRPLSPKITIESDPDNPAIHQIARSLSQMLARYGLGTLAAEGDIEAPIIEQPMIFWCSPGDIPLAYAFLSAIAPYIRGEVTIIKDPSYRPSSMRLQLSGTPRFYDNGSVLLH